MKKFTIVTTLTLFYIFQLYSTFGQREYLIQGKKYSEAKIHKKNFKDLRVTSVELINDSTLSYKNKDSKEKEQISTSNVRYLSIKKGSKVLPFALYGAGLGAIGVLAAVGSVVGDSNKEFRDNLGLRIAIIVGGSAALGAGIGALIPKWKRTYIKKGSHSTTFILYPGVYKNYYSLNLSINF